MYYNLITTVSIIAKINQNDETECTYFFTKKS